MSTVCEPSRASLQIAALLLLMIWGSAAKATTPPTTPKLLSAVTGLNPHFAAASTTFGVPLPLLKALSYVETRWQMVEGKPEFDSVPPAFGVMALRGEKLKQAALLTHISPEEVRRNLRANIFAGAALLRYYADEAGVRCGKLKLWQPVLLRYSGITEPQLQTYYWNEVVQTLQKGVAVRRLSGTVVATIKPDAVFRCLERHH